jgi:hypothetical protein
MLETLDRFCYARTMSYQTICLQAAMRPETSGSKRWISPDTHAFLQGSNPRSACQASQMTGDVNG